MSLNSDQEKALKFIQSWWFSSHQEMILDGPAGVGKSYLINEVLKTIPSMKPLIISPTHEALKQLRDKVEGDYPFKTAHSALGIAPIEDEKELDFEHIAYPSIWDKVNICIADEVSMFPLPIVKLLHGTKVKILWCGHAAQLPPVNKHRRIFDKCVSPVFQLDIPTITLTIPQRNTGKLWDFCNDLAEDVYNEKNMILPLDFDIKKTDLVNYVNSEGKEEIFQGKTKFILWTNNGVDKYNRRFRVNYFGEAAKEKPYLPGDKILLTKPVACVDFLEKHTDKTLRKLTSNKEIPSLYSNSKGTVIHAEEKLVKLNQSLHIPVWKITCDIAGDIINLYEPVFRQDHERIAIFYEHEAWGFKDVTKKKKAYKERNFIRSCFADIKHSYAMSAHRSQGSSIENVILIYNDIMKNPCSVERKKCLYVGASRAIKNLMVYRGL